MNHLTFLISMPGGSEWMLILVLFIPLYFLPSIVAGSRKHPNVGPIVVVNLLLGWTFIGWVGALIWGLSSTGTQGTTVVVNNSPQAYSQELRVETSEAVKIEQLKQLKQLLDEGVLTVEEFNKRKSAILG